MLQEIDVLVSAGSFIQHHWLRPNNVPGTFRNPEDITVTKQDYPYLPGTYVPKERTGSK